MKEGVLLIAIIAAADVRDHNARKNKNNSDHVNNTNHDGRYGTYEDYCHDNSDCASGYFCDMYPSNPWCEYCLG